MMLRAISIRSHEKTYQGIFVDRKKNQQNEDRSMEITQSKKQKIKSLRCRTALNGPK